MQKIPTLFERDWEGNRALVTELVTPGCEWVLDGEGNALRKWDGTCVMFDGIDWWARREVKAGKAAPAGFQPINHDDVTGKTIGWEPIDQSPFAKYHAEALLYAAPIAPMPDGTYELVGPKVQGNPERASGHRIVLHSFGEGVGNLDRSYDGLRAWLTENDWEGIVFHHPDGRMAKIKGRDFGIKRPA